MRILKPILLITATVALLLLCAALPTLAAMVQDRTQEKPQTAPLLPIHLELTPGTETPETEPAMGILEKLSILQQTYMFPLDPEEMTMTEDQVLEASLNALAPYISMGLIAKPDFPYSMPEPMIAMSADTLGSYTTFWSVHLNRNEDPYESVLLHLDDQTGLPLLIQYEGYAWTFEKEIHEALLSEFATTYLDTLQVSEALETLADPQVNVELVDVTDKATALSCTIETPEYGTLLIEFWITDFDFYVAFPSSPD